MNRTLKITLIIFSCLLVGAFGWWRYQVAGQVQTQHATILIDKSDSQRTDCDCPSSLAKRAMSDSAVTKQSTLTVLAIGSEVTANEPVAVAEYHLPDHRRVIDGRDSVLKREAEILNDLNQRCSQIPKSRRSPILLGVSRAIENLKGRGCQSGSGCRPFVVSDGEELADLSLKQAINGQHNKNASVQPLNNDGIRIIFVGVAETKGNFTRERDPERARRLQDAWRARVSVPDLVSFEPFCQTTNALSKQE